MADYNSKPLDNFNWHKFEKGQNSIEAFQNNAGYDEEPVFKQGIAIVKRGGKYGAIMVGGKEIIPTIYDALTEFQDGLAEVEYKGEKRMLNLSGQIQVKRNNEYVFIPEKYDWGRDYSRDTCVVEKNGKYGLLSDNFQELIEPVYNSIVGINNDAYLAIGEHKGIILSVTPQFNYVVSDCLSLLSR